MIKNNTYTGIRSNVHSKPIPINEPVHKSDLNYSYSRISSSWLPQEVAKELINRFSRKVIYASMLIDPVMNGFSLNEVKKHLHICYHSIITFGII